MKGVIFLIPTYLSPSNDSNFLAPMVLDVIKNTSSFLVENIRTSRRFISSLKLGIDITPLQFEVVDKKTDPKVIEQLMTPLKNGENIGVISEAGLPGLADPGSIIVSWAHKNNIQVVPLPGATSIQTAVITSGFSGQSYTFHGYLPIQKSERQNAIKRLEGEAQKTGYTQVFMETPFRNNSLLDDLLNTLSGNTLLHIASDVFGDQEMVKTRSIAQWKSSKPNLHKIPTIFCLGQFS